jgi:hypothetical protein
LYSSSACWLVTDFKFTNKHVVYSTGRFDFHIELRALAAPERNALLKHQVDEHELQCSEEVLSEIASRCDGYDAYDLVMLTLVIGFFLKYAGKPCTVSIKIKNIITKSL